MAKIYLFKEILLNFITKDNLDLKLLYKKQIEQIELNKQMSIGHLDMAVKELGLNPNDVIIDDKLGEICK
jgi:hypothetical protein